MLVFKASVSQRDPEEWKGWVVLAAQPWQHHLLGSSWGGTSFGGQTLSWAHPCGHAGS